jgi:hypothetical protein
VTDTKTVLRETCLPALAVEGKYFSIQTVRQSLRTNGVAPKRETISRYLVDLVKSGSLFNAGRGWYSTLPQPLLINAAPVKEVIQQVESAFPLLAFSCWSTEQVNPYMHHLLAKFVTFICADRDLMAAVFDELAGWKDCRVYLNPSSKEARKTFRFGDRTIVLRPKTSEAPTGEGHVAPFEKLLVDLAIEIETLSLMSKGEFQDMAWRVVTSGRISMAALARYARRNHRSLEDVFGERRSINGTK